MDLPWFHVYLGSLDEGISNEDAEREYRAAVAGFAAARDLRGQLAAAQYLWRMQADLEKRRDEARIELDRSLRNARGARDPLIVAWVKILEAKQLASSGHEMAHAYTLLQAAKGLLAPTPPHLERNALLFTCLTNLGNAAIDLGDYEAARLAYEQAFELARQDKSSSHMAAAQYGIARAAIEPFAEAPWEADRAKAIEATLQALRLATDSRNTPIASEADLALAGLERGAAARPHLEACLSETKNDVLHRGYCLNQRAHFFAAVHELDAAQEASAQALFQAGDDRRATALAQGSAMRVAWAAGRLDEVLDRGEQTLRAIEALRSGQETSDSQAGLFSTWSDDFYWFSGRMLQASGSRDSALLERAFDAAERLRARTLLDTLVKTQVAPPPREDLEERLSALNNALARVHARERDSGLPKIEREHAREDAAKLARERDRVNEDIKRLPTHPAKPPRYATLATIGRQLRPREALLSFQVAPWTDWTGDFGGGTWLVVATRDTAPHAYPLIDMGRPELRRKVGRLVRLLEPDDQGRYAEGRREEEAQALAAELYGKLLAVALAPQNLPASVDRLIVIPDDAFHRLPFGALREKPGAPPLARRYTISLAPSATLWLRGQTSTKPPTRHVLALANPPPPDGAALERFREAGINIPEERLRYAESEAATAVAFLGGETRTGSGVSTGSLLHADLSPFGLLHFAAHALADEVDPDSSGIWLSPGRGKAGDDGLLHMKEIARLALDRRVVVLSTCDSARGKLVRGEGVLSLARAFFEAHASAVVASLWPQRDDDSAALFERFYLHLAEGKSLAAALAAAQRDRMDEGAPPAAWAGFVVLGDGDLVPFPGGRSRLALQLIVHRRALQLATGAVAVALIAFTAARLRRRPSRP